MTDGTEGTGIIQGSISVQVKEHRFMLQETVWLPVQVRREGMAI